MAEEPKQRLGRGLAALIGGSAPENVADRVAPAPKPGQRKAPVEFLKPNSQNPRRDFAAEDLEDLTNSIREKGVLQPIVVRADKGGPDIYEIIAGERRWRAAQKAGLHEVPILIIEASDKEALELAIIENVQRADLSPLEEAEGYERLVRDYGYVQADIAKTIGKSRSHVANIIRLTKLSDYCKSLLSKGEISAGHARALLAVADPDRVANLIVQKGLTVRDVENMSSTGGASETRPKAPVSPPAEKDADTRDMERRLRESLGLDVSIQHKGESGQLVIRFGTFEQLDEVCSRLNA